MSEDNDRLIDLEMRYSHMEHLLEQLSDLVRVQQDTIDGLVEHVRKLREATLGNEQAPDSEPPPHY